MLNKSFWIVLPHDVLNNTIVWEEIQCWGYHYQIIFLLEGNSVPERIAIYTIQEYLANWEIKSQSESQQPFIWDQRIAMRDRDLGRMPNCISITGQGQGRRKGNDYMNREKKFL